MASRDVVHFKMAVHKFEVSSKILKILSWGARAPPAAPYSAVPDFTNVHIILLSQHCHYHWCHNTVLVLPILLVRRISLCYVCKLRLKVWLIRKKLQKHFSC